MSQDLILNIILFAGGIVILIRSGLWVVGALTKLAQFLGVSEYVASFILMAFATTLPEFSVGLSAAFSGNPALSLGNVFGSNIANLGLILGIIVLISGGIKVDDGVARRDSFLVFILASAPAILLLDFELSRWEGVFLILLFILYLSRLMHLREILAGRMKVFRINGPVGVGDFFKHARIFAVSSAVLLLSAFLLIEGAKGISAEMGVSELAIGLFFLAIGTSLPELSFGLRAALHHHEGLSVGNLLGAAVFNSTWVLGVTAVIAPIKIADGRMFWISAVAMIALVLLVNLFLRTKMAVSRREGAILAAIYAIFFIVELF
ncbi:MAG: sodium:calcium antiporter [Parcubacteria group bacterium]|nr:sodium:calcium antiporter [Parcubacteria group bacterium]